MVFKTGLLSSPSAYKNPWKITAPILPPWSIPAPPGH
jgi:hypothetical protein